MISEEDWNKLKIIELHGMIGEALGGIEALKKRVDAIETTIRVNRLY